MDGDATVSLWVSVRRTLVLVIWSGCAFWAWFVVWDLLLRAMLAFVCSEVANMSGWAFRLHIEIVSAVGERWMPWRECIM